VKMTTAVSALAAAVVFWWCGIAQAYRPFDGTDAAVADTGDVEIELAQPNICAREPSACCLRPI
jgi:hypothetical protein